MRGATVVLDVEGVLFKTQLATLTSIRSGTLAQLVAGGEWRKQLDQVSRHTSKEHRGFFVFWLRYFYSWNAALLNYHSFEISMYFRSNFFLIVYTKIGRLIWKIVSFQAGHLFIDRDSRIFPVVLAFLRDGTSIPLPRDEWMLQRIAHEVFFNQLNNLYPIMRTPIGFASFTIDWTSSIKNTFDVAHADIFVDFGLFSSMKFAR